MKNALLGATAGLLGLAATIVPGVAATLDDVVARLASLQRDNQAMRREIAALRQREQRAETVQAVGPRSAPSRAAAPVVGSAMAADFPVKAGGDFEPPRAFSWSGFYMGAHGGYGWGSSNWAVNNTTLPPGRFASRANPRSSGLLGGVQGGANHQFGNWVAGVEADFSLIDADAASADPLFAGGVPTGASMTAHSQIDWLASFSGRFGYAFDRSLLYLKGGVAGAGFNDNYTAHSLARVGDIFDGGARSSTRVGWTAGAGFEYALLNNWTARIEYDYLDFGTKDGTFVFTDSTGSIGFNQSIEHKLQVVKLGVNYRFGGDDR